MRKPSDDPVVITYTVTGEPGDTRVIVEATARVLLSARQRRQQPWPVVAVEEGDSCG